jgi:amino acid permease
MGFKEKEKDEVGVAIEPGMSSPIDIEHGDDGKLQQKLKGRHMQMIAIGGSIGAGLFVGSGGALASGGPGSLVIDFLITGFMLLLTVNALGELAGMKYPHSASAPNFSHSYYCSALSCCWSLLRLLCALHRPGLGICHGLELCHELACRTSIRTYDRGNHNRFMFV